MSSASSTTALTNAIASAAMENKNNDLQTLLDTWQSDDLEPLQPALYAALEQGKVDSVDLLLTRGCKCDFTATQAALKGLHIPVFECMLKHGWDVNYSLDHRGDALICAVSYSGSSANDLARWLLEHGADPNLNERSSPLSGTALEAACTVGAPEDIISLLIQRGADVKGSIAMLAAAWGGHIEVLRVLLDQGGVDINGIPEGCMEDLVKEEYWGTALHASAAKGKVETISFLLTRGARKDIRNGAGRTAKETAEHFGHSECVVSLA